MASCPRDLAAGLKGRPALTLMPDQQGQQRVASHSEATSKVIPDNSESSIYQKEWL